MKNNFITLIWGICLILGYCNSSKVTNLVPDTPSKAPDYLCTWNIQAYIVNYENSNNMRGAMLEENIFEKKEYQNWISFYPKIQEDLYFVMDNRVNALLKHKARKDAKGIINCEDEPYIAVGLGCAIGIMRHPFAGNLPDGRQDEAFPPVGHNYKKCLDEVVRAVRWHRIAEPFAVNADSKQDTVLLTDNWEIRKNETWNKGRKIGSILSESAPARISRNMELPIVNDTTSARPYVLSSRYPNGAVALAAIGRAMKRDYIMKAVLVTIDVPAWNSPVGIFGYFKQVTLNYPTNKAENLRIWAQDLAGDEAVDITESVEINGNQLILSEEIIKKVGLMAATPEDLSAPGLVVMIK